MVTYDPCMDELVDLILEVGGLIPDVAKVFGVDEATITEWCVQYPSFGKAIKSGLEFSEAWWEMEIERNLCNPAYDHERARDVMVKHFGWKE